MAVAFVGVFDNKRASRGHGTGPLLVLCVLGTLLTWRDGRLLLLMPTATGPRRSNQQFCTAEPGVYVWKTIEGEITDAPSRGVVMDEEETKARREREESRRFVFVWEDNKRRGEKVRCKGKRETVGTGQPFDYQAGYWPTDNREHRPDPSRGLLLAHLLIPATTDYYYLHGSISLSPAGPLGSRLNASRQ